MLFVSPLYCSTEGRPTSLGVISNTIEEKEGKECGNDRGYKKGVTPTILDNQERSEESNGHSAHLVRGGNESPLCPPVPSGYTNG